MRRCGQFGIGGLRRRILEPLCRAAAIAQPPGSKSDDPFPFRDPGPAAFRHCSCQRQRLGIAILDVVAPRYPLAPFRAGIGRQSGVDPVEQQARTIRIVIADMLENGAGDIGRHRAILDAPRAIAPRDARLAAQAARSGKAGCFRGSARYCEAGDAFGLRKIAIATDPVLQAFERNAWAFGVKIIFRQGGPVKRTFAPFAEQDLHAVPIACIHRFEKRGVVELVFLRQQSGQGAALALCEIGDAFGICLRGRSQCQRREGSSAEKEGASHAVHSSHWVQKCLRWPGMRASRSSRRAIISGISRPGRESVGGGVSPCERSGISPRPKASTR